MSSYSFPSSSSSVNDNSDDVFFDICDYLAFTDEAQEGQPPALLPTRRRRQNDNSDDVFFDICDYLALTDEAQEDQPPALPPTRHRHLPVAAKGDAEPADGARIRPVDDNDRALARKGRAGEGRSTATSAAQRVAFRTKTHQETLDDGYKWRKYGKKKVKNSPNPRNYYRCSSEGCNVKKRVQRESKDSSILVTSYDGIHNHHAPPPTGCPPGSSSEYCVAAEEMQK